MPFKVGAAEWLMFVRTDSSVTKKTPRAASQVGVALRVSGVAPRLLRTTIMMDTPSSVVMDAFNGSKCKKEGDAANVELVKSTVWMVT